MKYLPCLSGRCRGLPALATRAGILHSAGQMFGTQLSYICARCGRRSTLTGAAFSRLPDMTPDEIAAKTCDMPYTNPKDVPVEEKKEPLKDPPPPPPKPSRKKAPRRSP